ncbi:SdpA family antimicrobial peptide system protein [Nonomuraea sp. NPDC051941]|uniref:SdpA family antimicrobial peptide system protein n=1 Tax=Nonomuraea sp. NPDC051941 TaxID=3364373 RepID=UPI0037CC1F23
MSSNSRLGATAVALGLGWAVVIGYTVIGQLPTTAVELPAQRSVTDQARLIAPQGWAFFTKSARTPRELAWRRGADGTWQPALLGPHSEARNLWGLDRRSRAQAVDLGVLTAAVPAERWSKCAAGVPAQCLDVAGAPVPIRNPAPEPLLCGELALTKQEPLPWAWADAAGTTRMPISAVRLEVAC